MAYGSNVYLNNNKKKAWLCCTMIHEIIIITNKALNTRTTRTTLLSLYKST